MALVALELAVRDAVTAGTQGGAGLLLAVSGGRDSMVMLRAIVRSIPEAIQAVATFDHATGTFATEACALVEQVASASGLRVVRGRALKTTGSEASWRDARWTFLRGAASSLNARVATAHTTDDQLETVVQRFMRGAGTRGLAALDAPSELCRPLLAVTRHEVAEYALAQRLRWVEDPANADRRHQRVRLRLDLLPAIAATDATFAADMLSLSRRAGVWRRDVQALVAQLPWHAMGDGRWRLDRDAIEGWNEAQLGVVWPEMLAQAGIVLNADGTRRLVRFAIGSSHAGALQLPGGATVVRTRSGFEVRTGGPIAAAPPAQVSVHVVGDEWRWPGWRIRPISAPERPRGQPWVDDGSPSQMAFLPGATVELRAWRAGDRIRIGAAGASRRIARYLAECAVPRLDRSGWPVVLLNGEVVWVPGVCRGLAAPNRSGRSDLIWYHSERDFD